MSEPISVNCRERLKLSSVSKSRRPVLRKMLNCRRLSGPGKPETDRSS